MSTYTDQDAYKKVQQARTTLLLDQPFFGVLALRLKIVEDPTCPTAWTDGQSMGYNPKFIKGLSTPELTCLISHEVMHCAAGHPWRRNAREMRQWNVAADFAINQILVDAGFQLPKGGLLDQQYAGKWAEYIYDRLPKQPQQGQGSGQGQAGAGNLGEVRDAPSGGGNDDQDGKSGDQDGQGGQDGGHVPTEADWQQAATQSAQAAKARGKLPGSLERLIGDVLKPRVDWRSALRRFVQDTAKADYSYRLPNARYVSQGLYLPCLYSHECGKFAIAIDTSGSIDNVTLAHFNAELQSIVDEMKPSQVDVIYCDARVHRVDTFMRDEPITLKAVGGGGTAFEPVFNHIAAEGEEPQVLIFFTDLYGSFPHDAPSYPTLWAVFGNPTGQAPFGETLPID